MHDKVICSVPKCPKPVMGKLKVCSMHYSRMRKYGAYEPVGFKPRMRHEGNACSATDCPTPRRKGTAYCAMHYSRLKRHGNLEDPRPSLEERFWSHVFFGDECWEWQGSRDKDGYGTFGIGQRMCRATRVAWWLWYDELAAAGLFCCHRCDKPPCVNPMHLFLAPAKENTADMMSKGRSNFHFANHS